MTITVPSEYGLVIITAALIGFQCILQGFQTMGVRMRVFNKKFFEDNFPGKKAAKGGYPGTYGPLRLLSLLLCSAVMLIGLLWWCDLLWTYSLPFLPVPSTDMGHGRYSDKLEYDDWLAFANAQRGHYNYVEVVAPMIAIELLCGLFYARWAVLLGLAYVFGLVLYFHGYLSGGPKGRVLSLPFVDGAMLALFGLTFYGAWNAAGGVPVRVSSPLLCSVCVSASLFVDANCADRTWCVCGGVIRLFWLSSNSKDLSLSLSLTEKQHTANWERAAFGI